MLRQVLKQAFWDVYDHLGRLVLMNVLYFLVASVAFYYLAVAALFITEPLAGFVLFASLAFVFIVVGAAFGSLWFAGFLHFGELVSREKDPPARKWFTGIRQCGPRVFFFLLGWNSLTALLLLNVWFYFFSGFVPTKLQFIAYIVGGLFLWLVVLMVCILMHALPLQVRRARRFAELMKLGLGLTLKYPGATLGTLVFIASLLVIGAWLKFIGILFLGFALPAMLINSLHDVVIDALTEAGKAAAATKTSEKPTSWKQLQEQELEEEEERLRKARYNRTFRDILRPWEM